MNDFDYTIENLIDQFKVQSEEFNKYTEIQKKRYIEDYPDQEIPKHMTSTFNLSRALFVMATEIHKIKTIVSK